MNFAARERWRCKTDDKLHSIRQCLVLANVSAVRHRFVLITVWPAAN